MNVVAEIERINERELELGIGLEASWHQKYKDSAWVYVGGLAFELSEGDVICVMSQFGEIEDLNLVRDGKTGKSKGFAFVKYENWLSTVLAVDNMNGAKLLERTIRVDHVLKYKLPKEVQDRENEREARLLERSSEEEEEEDSDKRKKKEKKTPSQRGLPGHAYEGKELATQFDITQGQNVFDAPRDAKDEKKKRKKKDKKEKQDKKEKKAKKESKKKSVEQKQTEWMEHVRRQRQARQEELERALAENDGHAQAIPSETGWRGRLEPTAAAPPPQRRADDGAAGYDERERKRRAGYGGIDRIR